MNITKLYLALAGVLYALLALWCAVDPATTSRKVGLDLRPGSGQSEFLTVYAGLELAIALFLLSPWVWPAAELPALFFCLILHGCLVAFRTVSFLMFTGIDGTTWRLAAGEWTLFVLALAIWLWRQGTQASA